MPATEEQDAAARPRSTRSPTPTSGPTSPPPTPRQDFVTPEMEQPIPVRYPRDPTLDPQLVWKGKDDLDSEDLVADAPPIYIQEKIDPRVIIENLRDTAERPEDEPELTLFDTFDGLDELDLVDFYHHQANWSNRMILGDSLNVMASLAEREALRGKVQMIYVDPPYGIKFGSNWQVSARKRDVKDGKLEDAITRGRADQGVPRHLGVRHPLLPDLPSRPADCRKGPPHRKRLDLRPDRRRKRSSCPLLDGRSLRQRKLRLPDHIQKTGGAGSFAGQRKPLPRSPTSSSGTHATLSRSSTDSSSGKIYGRAYWSGISADCTGRRDNPLRHRR